MRQALTPEPLILFTPKPPVFVNSLCVPYAYTGDVFAGCGEGGPRQRIGSAFQRIVFGSTGNRISTSTCKKRVHNSEYLRARVLFLPEQ